jgi:antirestriction protein ArdC
LAGFLTKGVFSYEQTDGEPLPYREIKVPDLPLLDRASAWGISVKAIPGNFKYYGYFSPHRNEISLATPEEKTFFHELAHAAHKKLKGRLKRGQDPWQEIVAELSAQALCRMVGKRPEDSSGNSYRYIERYASSLNLSPLKACVKVIGEVEQLLGLILA